MSSRMKDFKDTCASFAGTIIGVSLFGLVVLSVSVSGVSAQQQPKAEVTDPVAMYTESLNRIDNVIANILLIQTPTGERGIPGSAYAVLQKDLINLQTCIAELKELKSKPKEK